MRAFLSALCLAALACGPAPAPPVRVMAIIPVETGSYETREVQLQTIGNLTTLKGAVAELVGVTRVTLDPNDPLQRGGIENLTEEQRYEVLVKDKGADVRGNYLERSGVYWPADFHTWNMVTTYWNFENAYLYFQDLAASQVPTQTPDELNKMKVMYWTELRLNSDQPVTDNALYLSFIKAFTITPFKNESKVPLPMNLGVIGHEVAHKVFSKRVFNDEGIPLPIRTWSGEAFNLLKSLDEGLADFHGFGTTCRSLSGCRPDILAVSISDEAYARQRDVSRADACMDEGLRQALKTFNQDMWIRGREMYLYGNLWASTLYQAGSKAGGLPKVKSLQVALLGAYNDERSQSPGLSQLITRNVNNQMAFTPEAVAEVIASHVADVDLRRAFCSEAMDRLQLQCMRTDCADKMPSCPGTTRRGTTCKVLPPLP
ncbi:MAG: hypothetical protein JNJ54_17180 [Myxococcaceae bacterium]|nr:hypothetical protein [Myxococcaceae bacterium]